MVDTSMQALDKDVQTPAKMLGELRRDIDEQAGSVAAEAGARKAIIDNNGGDDAEIAMVDDAGFSDFSISGGGILMRGTEIESVDDGTDGLSMRNDAGFAYWALDENGGQFDRIEVGGIEIEEIEDGTDDLLIVDPAGFACPLGGDPEIVLPPAIDTTILHANLHAAFGQSTMVGIENTVLTTTPPRPGRALMANAGIRALGTQNGAQAGVVLPRSAVTSLVDAVEVQVGNAGETGIAQFLADMTGTTAGAYSANEAAAAIAHAISGQPMTSWCPAVDGTLPYQLTNALRAWERLALVTAQAKGWTASVAAFHAEFTEAECVVERNYNNDPVANPPRPTDAEMIAGLERFLTVAGDYAAKLFCAPPPPIIFHQMSTWTNYSLSSYSVPVSLLEWWLVNQKRAILAGPCYDIEFTDGLHPDGTGQRRRMQRHARAFQRWRQGLSPLAFYPDTVTRSGGDLIVTFAGGVGDLAIDTTLVSDPGNNGLTWAGSGAISSVTRTGARQLTVSGTTGAGTLRFGTVAVAGHHGGPTTGPRTNFRDSDSFVGADGLPNYNWCCFRDITVS